MEFFETVRQVKTNWNPYKKWEIEQQKKEKQNELLSKKYPSTPEELEHAKQYGRTIVECINTMDQASIDKAEDVSFIVKNATSLLTLLCVGVGTTLGTMSQYTKAFKKKPMLLIYSQIIGAITGGMVASIIGNIWGATSEKQASRVARFQVRGDDLKDSRHFVVYNNEQIKKAQEIAKTLPEVEEKKRNLTMKKSLNPIATFSKAGGTTKSLSKDYSKYNQWKKDYLKAEAEKKAKFKQINPSTEELSKAQKDRDVMLGTIKKIETSSLNYLLNMKLAILTIETGLVLGGIGAGFGAVKILDMMQKNKRFEGKAEQFNIAKLAGLKFIPIIPILLVIGPIVKLYKDAARIGRYKAKKELLSNPQNFVAYDEQQRKTVESPKSSTDKKGSFWSGVKKDINSVKHLKKDYVEYHQYMKTEHKEELKLQEALKQVEISDKQKSDAVKLQKDAFHSFEKMDEKAQRYTDDTDAAVDISRKVVASVLNGAGRILSISILLKKLQEYKMGELKSANVLKAMKHFKVLDVVKIVSPMFAPMLINLPLAVRGIQIQKEAGKIGVMTAMKDLEDPKNFLDEKKAKS